ncbi:hypothetical protein CsatB_006406 [Cannabis sativa]
MSSHPQPKITPKVRFPYPSNPCTLSLSLSLLDGQRELAPFVVLHLRRLEGPSPGGPRPQKFPERQPRSLSLSLSLSLSHPKAGRLRRGIVAQMVVLHVSYFRINLSSFLVRQRLMKFYRSTLIIVQRRKT